MAHWNSRGLRGSTLEELINLTNEGYRQKGLALIQKLPTSIIPVEQNRAERIITMAYWGEKSTVDYMGVVQGYPVCFDAKETARKNLPFDNLHEHQIDFMRDFQAQQGIAFLLVYFKFAHEYFYLPFDLLDEYWRGAKTGGRKSIPYEAIDASYKLRQHGAFYIHYLEGLQAYLDSRK